MGRQTGERIKNKTFCHEPGEHSANSRAFLDFRHDMEYHDIEYHDMEYHDMEYRSIVFQDFGVIILFFYVLQKN